MEETTKSKLYTPSKLRLESNFDMQQNDITEAAASLKEVEGNE